MNAPRWAFVAGSIAGVVLATLGWWAVYSAWRTYGDEAGSLGPGDDLLSIGARVAVGSVALFWAIAAVRWRSFATGLALTGIAWLAISAYLRLVADGSLFLVGLASTPPGQGLSSANPLLGALNDLGYAVTEAVFAPPLLLLSSGWLGIALAWWLPGPGRTAPEGVSPAGRRWVRLLTPLLGVVLAVVAMLVTFIASRATLSMLVSGHDELSALQPAVLLATGTVTTVILLRLPAALVGAALVAAVALAVSALGPAAVGWSNVPGDRIWSFALQDVTSTLGSAAYDADLLVLFATWCAGLLGWALWRARD